MPKDIVDIQVTVTALFPKEPLIAAFVAGGYQVRGDLQEDHRPAGDRRPGTEWQKRYCREPEGTRRVHIHVRVAGAANQRYALLFRDFLWSHVSAAGSYDQIKRELARLHPHDIDAYLAIKDPVCDLIMTVAELLGLGHSLAPRSVRRLTLFPDTPTPHSGNSFTDR